MPPNLDAIWTLQGGRTPYLNAQALCLNGQAILYSPPGTGTIRQRPMHAHVCVWKGSMTPSKPTLPSTHAFVVQFHTRPRGRRRGAAALSTWPPTRWPGSTPWTSSCLHDPRADGGGGTGPPGRGHRGDGGRAQRGSSCTSRRATLEGHIWTRPRCQGALEWNNTLQDRCSHISGL